MLGGVGVHLRELKENGRLTGGAPSTPALSKAMTAAARAMLPGAGPCRIAEIGPGVGTVTKYLLRELRAGDEMLLVEANTRLAAHLRRSLERDVRFQTPAAVRVIEGFVQDVTSSAGEPSEVHTDPESFD